MEPPQCLQWSQDPHEWDSQGSQPGSGLSLPSSIRPEPQGGPVAPGGSRNIWETRTRLSLLQSCLDIALLALQHFLHLLQLMDGFATQTDLVSQIRNFLCQGQKEFGQEGVCGASPAQATSPSPAQAQLMSRSPLESSQGCAWGHFCSLRESIEEALRTYLSKNNTLKAVPCHNRGTQ